MHLKNLQVNRILNHWAGSHGSSVSVATLSPRSSLTQKVAGTQAAFAEGAGSYTNTCNKTNAITNEARSESGTILTAAQAAEVIGEAALIRSLLQC